MKIHFPAALSPHVCVEEKGHSENPVAEESNFLGKRSLVIVPVSNIYGLMYVCYVCV